MFVRKRSIIGHESNLIYWIQDSLLGFRIGRNLKRLNPHCNLFLEMSEFPDFYKEHHLSNRVRFLKDWKLNEYRKNIVFLLDGIALMTKTLIKDFENTNNIPVLHLPMTVDF